MQGQPTCECGCGTALVVARYPSQQARYAHGHNRRGLEGKRLKAEHWRAEDRGYETPCWVWQLATSRGYGKVRVAGKKYRAHRYYWEQKNGPVPDGLELDHLCGQRACVNPDHLEPVTHAVNCRRRARHITPAQAAEIRNADGSLAEIGARYGISKQQVWRIRKGTSWALTTDLRWQSPTPTG